MFEEYDCCSLLKLPFWGVFCQVNKYKIVLNGLYSFNSNIQELILMNADYLVNSISLRLRHLMSNPKAPLVLKVTVTYSNKDILPVIDDTITEVM